MPRHDGYEDDERNPPTRRRPMSPVLIVALVLGGCLFLGACLAVAGFALLWSTVESDRRPAGGVDAKVGAKPAKVYTRDEFKAAVMGKTADEVIAAVGKPDWSTDQAPGPHWYYANRTKDPRNEKSDASAELVFKDGKVAEVNY